MVEERRGALVEDKTGVEVIAFKILSRMLTDFLVLTCCSGKVVLVWDNASRGSVSLASAVVDLSGVCT